MSESKEMVQGTLDEVLIEDRKQVKVVRPGDPDYEDPMEAIHGPWGLKRPAISLEEVKPRRKSGGKRVVATRWHPIDGSAGMREANRQGEKMARSRR